MAPLVRKLQNAWEGAESVVEKAIVPASNGIIDRASKGKVLL